MHTSSASASGTILYYGIFALFIVMIVWMFWQQSRQQKEKQKFQAGLRRGDRVVTQGGLIGTVRDIRGDRAVLEVGEHLRVEVLLSAVSQRYEPAGGAGGAPAGKEARPAEAPKDGKAPAGSGKGKRGR
ncbi:protein of unknown function [Candidatus Hydrogenisulfobacillus filiaventi]|uniref:Preprotein translocase subunit YajC n=1 Tax=Candidatus Hydrogenisulfobacillus filiaventi TaxID=2707344 RepID=A0A6F8ZFE5_9FIRM|nr:preprotein translocase subunit YajC [Bacillota bacterium]CAB1128424.1 protein of unknown function [Candidatus Hydrogenisulfobacillus filiaventi]